MKTIQLSILIVAIILLYSQQIQGKEILRKIDQIGHNYLFHVDFPKFDTKKDINDHLQIIEELWEKYPELGKYKEQTMDRLFKNEEKYENQGVFFYDYVYSNYFVDNPGRQQVYKFFRRFPYYGNYHMSSMYTHRFVASPEILYFNSLKKYTSKYLMRKFFNIEEDLKVIRDRLEQQEERPYVYFVYSKYDDGDSSYVASGYALKYLNMTYKDILEQDFPVKFGKTSFKSSIQWYCWNLQFERSLVKSKEFLSENKYDFSYECDFLKEEEKGEKRIEEDL